MPNIYWSDSLKYLVGHIPLNQDLENPAYFNISVVKTTVLYIMRRLWFKGWYDAN